MIKFFGVVAEPQSLVLLKMLDSGLQYAILMSLSYWNK